MPRSTALLVLGIVLSLFSSVHGADEIALVRDRLAQSVLPTQPQDIQRLHESVAKFADSLQADGSWPDVKYDSKERTQWPAAQHLVRIVGLAKSARLHRDAGHPDAQLDAKILAAIKYWTDHDFQDPNWWWNQIGVPQLLGEIACLQSPELPPDQLAAVVKIMKRSDWAKWTGANLTWGVTIQIMRGCLEQSPQIVADAYARMYEEIRVVPQDQEGIQADWSFHQHGQQLYNGGYGLAFANDVGRFIGFAWGTSFQVPAGKMRIYSAYVLDGERWMTYGDVFDYSAVGRELTRAGKVAAPRDWSRGPISPAGPAYSLPNVCDMLASLGVPRRDDLVGYKSLLIGDGKSLPMIGNRQFWCSDYMVHRREGFMTSVKMFSTRIKNAENVNSEGRQSQHLSDGANLIYVDGNEYRDIFPVWDWNKIPGTTAVVLDNLAKDDPHGIGITGKSDFAGGVSDGMNGLCTMELIRDKLSAKKSWFFFDHAYACLGAGITLDGGQEATSRDVMTSINQARLTGDVLTDTSTTPLPTGQHQLNGIHWIHHNQIGYVFPTSQQVSLSNADQSGRWSDFGTGSDKLETLPVFNLSIDHGHACGDASYTYFVLPATSASDTATWAKSPEIEILSNTPTLQAAFDAKLHLAQIAFFSAGQINTPVGQIGVNQPCLLMVRIGHGIKITAANPRNQPMDLIVQIGDQSIPISLPGGLTAGASVSKTIEAR